jgi:tRNA-dihydrouridine synthase B
MAEAARVVQDLGATIVDINMGCPSKKVCAHSGGSALMKDLPLAAEIIRAVRAVVSGPMTVKMRSGFDAERRNAPELARICQEEGVDAITIHWRTREDGYGGARAVDKIAQAVDAVRIPVLGNGDVLDVPSAERMLRETGCAGLMIGRGAIRNPWIFTQLSQWLRGEEPVVVDAAEKRRAMLRYFRTISEAIPRERSALGRMKMLSRHFTDGLPGWRPGRPATGAPWAHSGHAWMAG